MKRSKQRVLIAIVLAVLGMGVGSVSWWLLNRQDHPQGERKTAEQSSSQSPGSGAPAEISSSDPEDGLKDIEDIVKKERQRLSTAESLIKKGFPPISTPRRDAIKFAASRSLEEVARDLGDTTIIDSCRNRDVWGGTDSMEFWASGLSEENFRITGLFAD